MSQPLMTRTEFRELLSQLVEEQEQDRINNQRQVEMLLAFSKRYTLNTMAAVAGKVKTP